jgi:hypothetical protein
MVVGFTRVSQAQKHKKASGKAVVLNMEDFDTPEKIAKQSEDYIDISGEKYLKKFNVKKIGILEFYVEFFQNKELQESAYETRTEGIKFSGDFYKNAVQMSYDLVTGELTKSGFEFLPKDTMGNDSGYKKLELASEAEGGGYTGGVFQRSMNVSTIKLSVEGLGLLPVHAGMGSVFAALSKSNSIKSFKAHIAKDKGLDAVAEIFIYIAKGKEGEPVISTFNIALDMGPLADIELAHMEYEHATTIALKKPFTTANDVSGKESNTVDAAKYSAALSEMVGIIVKMAGSAMVSAMK